MSAKELQIPGSDFFKSLGKLEAMAKGQEEEKEEEEKKKEMEKAQLFHTASNSERKEWEGGDSEDIGDNWSDSIGKDGTDYHAARKSIAEKVMKGHPLTPEDIRILKSDIEKSEEEEREEDKGKPSSEEKEKSMEKCATVQKSFETHVQANQTLHDALEMSDFLQEFAKAFGSGLGYMEDKTADMIQKSQNAILNKIGNYVEKRFDEQGEFFKSLAEAVVNIGHGLANVMGIQAESENLPARGPKSVMVPQGGNGKFIEKSFGGSAGGNEISKSMKLDVMCDMVQKGQLSALDVCKFETSGQIHPELEARIIQMIQSGGK